MADWSAVRRHFEGPLPAVVTDSTAVEVIFDAAVRRPVVALFGPVSSRIRLQVGRPTRDVAAGGLEFSVQSLVDDSDLPVDCFLGAAALTQGDSQMLVQVTNPLSCGWLISARLTVAGAPLRVQLKALIDNCCGDGALTVIRGPNVV